MAETYEEREMAAGGSRPVPDPTVLTSRAVDALRKEQTDIKAVELAAIRKEIRSLAKLTNEQFKSVAAQLEVAEKLRLEQKVDTKTAVDAALAAQKEQATQQTQTFEAQTNKTEKGFSEQIKGMDAAMKTAGAAQDVRHNDLKDRVTRIEERKIGAQTAVAAGATVLVALVSLFTFLAINDSKTRTPDSVVVEVPTETP